MYAGEDGAAVFGRAVARARRSSSTAARFLPDAVRSRFKYARYLAVSGAVGASLGPPASAARSRSSDGLPTTRSATHAAARRLGSCTGAFDGSRAGRRRRDARAACGRGADARAPRRDGPAAPRWKASPRRGASRPSAPRGAGGRSRHALRAPPHALSSASEGGPLSSSRRWPPPRRQARRGRGARDGRGRYRGVLSRRGTPRPGRSLRRPFDPGWRGVSRPAARRPAAMDRHDSRVEAELAGVLGDAA